MLCQAEETAREFYERQREAHQHEVTQRGIFATIIFVLCIIDALGLININSWLEPISVKQLIMWATIILLLYG